MNTSKSLNQILIDFLKEDDDGNVNLAKAKADIVEAVEGLIGPDVKTKELWEGATVMDSGSINWYKDRLRQAIKEWQ